jgi:DNA integrity scanning protein DisA with diadenylate cyclase activity
MSAEVLYPMDELSDLLGGITEGVEVVLLFTPGGSTYERFAASRFDIVVAAPTNSHDADRFVRLPVQFNELRDRFRFGIEGAIQNEYVGDDETLVCAARLYGDDIDTVTRVRTSSFERAGVYDLFVDSRAKPGVIRDVLNVTIELGKKGQKGSQVGALFVVGDAGHVMNGSRALSYNPFEKSHVDVGDPIVNVMLKEFSRLDGAFVISDSGKIVSAYRYLEPSTEGVEIPKGLGARHMAAGAITRATEAVAIVLSESDGLIRAFKEGTLMFELDPEDY